MILYNLLLLSVLLFILNNAQASNVLRPRGVSLKKSSLYDPAKDFTCFDGSGKIPFKYVNDDYCDCQDGSDEPGTAACPNGTFFCSNTGHFPSIIPSSRVNDGICDCCDASDEYGTNSDCEDVCLERGREAREEAIRMMKEQERGFEIKQQMINDAQSAKTEKQAKLEQLKKEQELAQTNKEEKEKVKQECEEPESAALEGYRKIEEEERLREEATRKAREEEEAAEAFQQLDTDQDGMITLAEIQSKQQFDTDRDGQVSDEEAKFYLQQEESMVWEKFLESGWKLIRPVYLHEQQLFTPPTPSPTDEEEPSVHENQEEVEEESELDRDEELGEEYDHDMNEEIPEDEEEEEELEEDEEDYGQEEVTKEQTPPPPKYDEETQRLIDIATHARNEFNEADKALKDLERQIKDIESSLEKDYGANDEFRVMEGQCFDFNDREYTYTLCPFDKTVQKSKNGYGEVRLGQWGEWTGEENKYSTMKYTNGQQCWNGPQRTAEVRLTCGTENVVTSVSEPNRCEYLYLFTTPAACSQITKQYDHVHSEL